MSDWEVITLPEVLDFQEGPGIMARDFRDAGVPLIRLAGLKQGASLLAGCNYLDPEMVAKRWSHFRLQQGDVLLSTSASLGEVATVSTDGVSAIAYTGIIRFRPIDNRMISGFIPIALRSPQFAAQIEAMGVGSVMRHFGPSHLKKMTIPLPPLRVQEEIAELLGALDDKIAVNDRIAECSLALADAHFARAVEGIPTGPETFGSIAQVGGGGTPSTKVPEYWDGNTAWATPSDVTALGAPYLFGTGRRITDAGLDNCASALYPAGSIFMTSRATIGAFAIPQVPMAVNQGFIVVVTPDEELMMWLFHEMRDRVDEMRSLANGSTFLELSRKNFKAMGVRLPTPTALKEFAGKAIPLHQMAATATAESATLIKLRDTLLPELMSGRLRVRDVEKAVKEAV